MGNSKCLETQKCGQYQKILRIVRYKVLQRMSESVSELTPHDGRRDRGSLSTLHSDSASVVSCDWVWAQGLIGAKRGRQGLRHYRHKNSRQKFDNSSCDFLFDTTPHTHIAEITSLIISSPSIFLHFPTPKPF